MAGENLKILKKDRQTKLKALVEAGVNPYPSKLQKEPQSIKSALTKKDGEVVVVGRIMSIRKHGGVFFADLKDENSQIQLFFQKKILKDKLSQVSSFDVGDFLLAWGKIFKTEAGEKTVDVNGFQYLVKTMHPLPPTWHALEDVEERYRKRYLDTLLNPEVKERLTKRSHIISALRDFLDKKDFIEVETPTLQPVYGGGFARPFVTHHNALDADFYLRISDEMYLKRLIVGGFQKVYEITKVFRNEGVDRDHNPEFTMFEAQIAYEDYYYGMDIIEEIIEHIAKKVFGRTEFEYQGVKLNFKRPWKRMRVVEAVLEYTGADPLEWKTLSDAKKAVNSMHIEKDKLKELGKVRTIGEVIAFLFEELVEEKLLQPTIIYDYPVEVSPLAKKCEDERFTQRFEMFAAGVELGNNYSELNDPEDLRKRFVEEKEREKAGFDEAHQTDEDYLLAIEHGFPPTCGIAIGIDRMVMMMTNAKTIKEVIPFPTLRPEVKGKKSKSSEGKSTSGGSTTREEVYELVTGWTENKNLVKHMLAVEAEMRALAKHFGESEDDWGLAGLVHDADYEKWPKEHPRKLMGELKKMGAPDWLYSAVETHAWGFNDMEVEPRTRLEWALYTCDELSGFIIACALVRPDKKLASVTVDSILKKWPQKAFAKGVHREQIELCEEKLGIKKEEYISICLKALQGISKELEL